MSASTQQTTVSNGNGQTQRKPRTAASIAKQKATAARTLAAKQQLAPLQGQTTTTGITGAASQANVAARRIGAVPGFTTPGPIAVTAQPGTIGWLYHRQQELEIESRLIRSMIASFGPRAAMTTGGAPKKAKSKSKKRRATLKTAA